MLRPQPVAPTGTDGVFQCHYASSACSHGRRWDPSDRCEAGPWDAVDSRMTSDAEPYQAEDCQLNQSHFLFFALFSRVRYAGVEGALAH